MKRMAKACDGAIVDEDDAAVVGAAHIPAALDVPLHEALDGALVQPREGHRH